MKEEDFLNIVKDVEASMQQPSLYKSCGSGISSDISDIGNEIGIAVGKHIVKLGLDKEDFIHGIKHGISLEDGTH